MMPASKSQLFIVDDDASFGRSLKRLLNARGISADYFSSAQSFFDSVSPDQEGFVIVDIHMPVCDGFAMMDKMQEMRYVMPAIMITGQAKAGARDLAIERGALGFLQKPFSEESLLEVLNSTES